MNKIHLPWHFPIFPWDWQQSPIRHQIETLDATSFHMLVLPWKRKVFSIMTKRRLILFRFFSVSLCLSLCLSLFVSPSCLSFSLSLSDSLCVSLSLSLDFCSSPTPNPLYLSLVFVCKRAGGYVSAFGGACLRACLQTELDLYQSTLVCRVWIRFFQVSS